MKQILLKMAISIISVSVSLCSPGFAERSYLSSPDPITFDKSQYFADDYLAYIEECKQLLQAYSATDIIAQLEQLKNIYTDEESDVLPVIEEIKAAIQSHENEDLKEDRNISRFLKKLEDFVKYNSFYFAAGFDFEADTENRRYILSWYNQDEQITKQVPFPPEMKVKVKADIVQENGNKTYQYVVINSAQSSGSAFEFLMESQFPKTHFKGRYLDDIQVNNNIVQPRWLPGPGKNFFRFKYYIDQKVAGFLPGEALPAPFMLEKIDNSLPGIVDCYVSVYEFRPQEILPYGEVPEAATYIFVTGPDTRTMGMYKGTTIGPVPVPTDYNKADFIQTIIGYNQQAIDEGWVEDAAVATYTTDTLQAIAADPDNTAQINTFLSQIEGHYTDGKLLSEAYALLKYNLEYLLSHN